MLRTMLRDTSTAEDCAQEAFAKAYKAWPKWRPEGSADAWVHRIAANCARSYFRYEKLRSIGEVIRRIGPPQDKIDPTKNDAAMLLEALREMKPNDAAVLVLRHYHGYSNREIATVLRISESTIATRLSTAKDRLRKQLETSGIDAAIPAARIAETGATK